MSTLGPKYLFFWKAPPPPLLKTQCNNTPEYTKSFKSFINNVNVRLVTNTKTKVDRNLIAVVMQHNCPHTHFKTIPTVTTVGNIE